MSDREKALNQKPLNAFESMKNDIETRLIPGFEKRNDLDKDNFRRFNKKGIAQALLHGPDPETQSFLSGRGQSLGQGVAHTARDNEARRSLQQH